MFLDDLWSPKNILNAINKEVFLPQIQRGYEWEEDRIEQFFDSLVKDIPLGLVLVYQHDGSFPLQGRKFLEEYDDAENKSQYEYNITIQPEKLVVLDGQQRLQSLYLGIKGSFKGKILYHDVLWINRPVMQNVSFVMSEPKGECFREDGRLFVKMSTLYDIVLELRRGPNREERLKHFKSLCAEKGIVFASDEEANNIYDYIKENLYHILCDADYFKKKLSLQIIRPEDISGSDDKLSTLLEIFVRFNRGGLRLEKSDLIFSTLKARGWIESESNLNELSEDVRVPKDLLLKALMAITDIDIGIDIFKAAGYSDRLKEAFPEFKSIMERLYDRISTLTQIPENLLNKFNFQIPVVYYLSKRPAVLDNPVLPSDVLRYMLVVAYNCTLRSDNYLQRIIEKIKEHINRNEPGFPVEDIFRYMRDLGVKTELDGESLNRDPLLTFSLIQRNCWNPLYKGNRLHVDHIFPRAKIDELPEDSDQYIDSIWNKYVVFQGDNIRKTDTLPEEYFTGERARLKDAYILPDDPSLLKKENFLKFIEWRRNKIVQLFKDNLGIDISIYAAPSNPSEGIRTDEMEVEEDYNELIIDALSKIYGEKPLKLGRAQIYKVAGKHIIARASRQYPTPKTGYWYGITTADLERIQGYGVSEYVFIMIGKGTLVLPVEWILDEIQNNNFDKTKRQGSLYGHYHMRLDVSGDRVLWILRDREVDVTDKVYPL